ncbi:ogr/Delta-like zinc finger family protein [Serratia sp. UGAL515B_01]|uniref:ogr/Delta-like zinc finger family protein n=1 Tax=Serratia sp. UGAL515B_01 TaxID=2986763 RepID=UPI002954D2C2|nr:ogr/Delta-like zinc finger family protein [Serratia sp. UGAL515B_01]WON77424.1 ogr/Delta-like zinc finger family protein [Serratia sp. UGAL515B_01]
MINCPLCHSTAQTRATRYLTDGSKEMDIQCQNIECSATYRTKETVCRVIREPIPPQMQH